MKFNFQDITEYPTFVEIDATMSWYHIYTNPERETRGKVNLYCRLNGVEWDTHIGCLLRAIPFMQHDSHGLPVGESLHALIFNGEGGKDLLNILVAPSMSTFVPNYYQYGQEGNRVFVIAKDLSGGFVDFAIEFDSEKIAEWFAKWFALNTGLDERRFEGDVFDHRRTPTTTISPFTISFERFALDVQNHVASRDNNGDSPPVLPNPKDVVLEYRSASDYTAEFFNAKYAHNEKIKKLFRNTKK